MAEVFRRAIAVASVVIIGGLITDFFLVRLSAEKVVYMSHDTRFWIVMSISYAILLFFKLFFYFISTKTNKRYLLPQFLCIIASLSCLTISPFFFNRSAAETWDAYNFMCIRFYVLIFLIYAFDSIYENVLFFRTLVVTAASIVVYYSTLYLLPYSFSAKISGVISGDQVRFAVFDKFWDHNDLNSILMLHETTVGEFSGNGVYNEMIVQVKMNFYPDIFFRVNNDGEMHGFMWNEIPVE